MWDQAYKDQLVYATNWYSEKGAKPPSQMDLYSVMCPDDPKVKQDADDKEVAAEKRRAEMFENVKAREERWSKMGGKEIKINVPEKYRENA